MPVIQGFICYITFDMGCSDQGKWFAFTCKIERDRQTERERVNTH